MPLFGCGQADITPKPGLPMVGMPGSQRGEGVQWPLRSLVFLIDYGDRRGAAETAGRGSAGRADSAHRGRR